MPPRVGANRTQSADVSVHGATGPTARPKRTVEDEMVVPNVGRVEVARGGSIRASCTCDVGPAQGGEIEDVEIVLQLACVHHLGSRVRKEDQGQLLFRPLAWFAP